MDETLINSLKEYLKPKDTLYFLGDLSFKKASALKFFEALNNLEIEIHFIIGNHDSDEVIKLTKEFCITVSYLKDIIINKFIYEYHFHQYMWHLDDFKLSDLTGYGLIIIYDAY
ncbi:hypothetical protein LCGC14_1824840, partial [marine sediment metagenome]